MPKLASLIIDRGKVIRGTIRDKEGNGCMCALGHYRVAAEMEEDLYYDNLRKDLGDAVEKIYEANDFCPRGAWEMTEAQILAHNEPRVIKAFADAGVTVTYVGEYREYSDEE